MYRSLCYFTVWLFLLFLAHLTHAGGIYICSEYATNSRSSPSSEDAYILMPIDNDTLSNYELNNETIKDFFLSIRGIFIKQCWFVTNEKGRQMIKHITMPNDNLHSSETYVDEVSYEISASSGAKILGYDSFIFALIWCVIAWHHYGSILYGVIGLGISGAILFAIDINNYYNRPKMKSWWNFD